MKRIHFFKKFSMAGFLALFGVSATKGPSLPSFEFDTPMPDVKTLNTNGSGQSGQLQWDIETKVDALMERTKGWDGCSCSAKEKDDTEIDVDATVMDDYKSE